MAGMTETMVCGKLGRLFCGRGYATMIFPMPAVNASIADDVLFVEGGGNAMVQDGILRLDGYNKAQIENGILTIG